MVISIRCNRQSPLKSKSFYEFSFFLLFVSDLPTSYIEKNLRNTVITLQPNSAKSFTLEDKNTHGSLSISSINSDPIFMIYNKDNCSESGDSVKKIRKSLWRLPNSTRVKSIWWVYTWPIKCILTLTIPNPKTFRRLYPLTFVMCIIWIGLNAYMIVWMISVIGQCQKKKKKSKMQMHAILRHFESFDNLIDFHIFFFFQVSLLKFPML